jgi:hypothetical protein
MKLSRPVRIVATDHAAFHLQNVSAIGNRSIATVLLLSVPATDVLGWLRELSTGKHPGSGGTHYEVMLMQIL